MDQGGEEGALDRGNELLSPFDDAHDLEVLVAIGGDASIAGTARRQGLKLWLGFDDHALTEIDL